MTDVDQVAPGAVEAWRRHLGEEVDVAALRAELVEGSLTRAFHDATARDPERTALTIDDETVTYVELDSLAA